MLKFEGKKKELIECIHVSVTFRTHQKCRCYSDFYLFNIQAMVLNCNQQQQYKIFRYLLNGIVLRSHRPQFDAISWFKE